MSNYWSSSKFADWLRGTPSPNALSSPDWQRWRQSAEAAHPVRYWLAEEGLDHAQDFLTWPVKQIYDIKYYINNRWVTRTHQLTAHRRDIAPGTWHDVGYRFLPCLFNELVDYVEVELAWWNIAWDKEARIKYQAPWYASGWFRWRTWRSPECGLDNLRWQMELTHEDADGNTSAPQADKAREILALYDWWTEQRPKRVDPMKASGWTAYCNRRRSITEDWFSDAGKEDTEDTTDMLDMMNKLEEQYEQEDEDMMIRLIKIRQALWT